MLNTIDYNTSCHHKNSLINSKLKRVLGFYTVRNNGDIDISLDNVILILSLCYNTLLLKSTNNSNEHKCVILYYFKPNDGWSEDEVHIIHTYANYARDLFLNGQE